MGLRDDIRNAMDTIIIAAEDAAHTMRHGEDEVGQVVQTSSREFAEPVTADAPAEAARFICNAATFPTIDYGEAVELDDSLRVVVTLKQDPVGATFTAGLSAPFEKTPATYTGKRRDTGSVRQLRFPMDVLFVENGVADNFTDTAAPTYATGYTLAIRRADWQDATEPEVADAVEIAQNGYAIALKVSAVKRHDGWYILNCRTRD